MFETSQSGNHTHSEMSRFGDPSYGKTIVDFRINETPQTGAVANRTYRAGESVYLFFEFTINDPSSTYDESGKDLPTSLKVPPSRSKFARCGNSEQGILYP